MFKSLKTKLLIWYTGSLLVLIAYFLLFIHFYSIPYGMVLLAVLFIILGAVQFIILRQITHSITSLSTKIKLISSKNLADRITNIHSEDEIGELAFSFNSLLDRLQSAFQRERQFVGDVAHELKTPIATLKSSFEVALSNERSNDEYKKVTRQAVIEADKLSATLNNVLDLAWSETPHQRKQQSFNLSELLAELSEIAQKLAVAKNITVNLSNIPNIKISGFKEKLARALLNLIDNAIKYSPSKSKIELRLEKTPTKAVISVIDQGKGIPANDLPYIFDRFYRGSETQSASGSGLGLAIAKSIITLHGGEIKVKSNLRKGSTFIVVLPLV